MRRLAIIATFALLAACSSDSGTADNNGSAWDLDAGVDSGANGTTNGSPNGSTNGSPNGSTNGTPNGSTNGTPNGSTNGTPNGATNGNTTGNGNGSEGTDCTLNSDCNAGLICCAGFDGSATCETDCFTGGLCGGNENECNDGMECCDLSGIGAPDTCLEQCRGGGGGGGGTPCDTNADCTNAMEVCCPGLDGMGECSTDCFTGGLCEDDMDCQNGQMCCDFNVSKVCLDQCSF